MTRAVLLGLIVVATATLSRPLAAEPVPGPRPRAAATIIERPITFDAVRERLTLEYRRVHQDPAISDLEIAPRLIVVHYTGGRSATATWRYFNRSRLEKARRSLHGGGALNVSAHFLVDRDGSIFRLMPETRMARHTIGLNHLAIGIENVGDGDANPLTAAQLDANAALVRDLASRFPITHLIGHHESRQMEGHPYWLERDAGYRNRKPDPGKAFMSRLRAAVSDLGLDGPPARAPRRRAQRGVTTVGAEAPPPVSSPHSR